MVTSTDLPILIIYFNRPDIFSTLLDSLATFEPREIFLSCDGARNSSDDDSKITACEELIRNKITWECNLHHNKAKFNHGCDVWIPISISWFFNQVEAGIILEDDCLIGSDFYIFCCDLIHKYWDNSSVMNISAPNFQIQKWGTDDYYFSKYPSNWAWATWRRAWLNFSDVTNLDAFLKSNENLKKIIRSPVEQKFWKRFFAGLSTGKYTYWDAKWLYSIWRCSGVSITPNVNLSSNIGFGKSATHTKKIDPGHNLKIHPISIPLKHPQKIQIQEEADFFLFNSRYKPTIKGRINSATEKFKGLWGLN